MVRGLKKKQHLENQFFVSKNILTIYQQKIQPVINAPHK